MTRTLEQLLDDYDKATAKQPLRLEPKELDILHKHNLGIVRSRTKEGNAPQISPDIEAYRCAVTGKMIDGRKEHRENLERTGSRVWEPGETKESIRKVKESADAEGDRIAETITKEIYERARDAGVL